MRIPEREEQPDDNPSVSTRQLDFLLRAITGWVVAAFAIGGGFLNYHFTALGIAFVGAGLAAILFDLWLYSKYDRPNWREVTSAPLIIFLQLNFCGAFVAAGATYFELFPQTFRLVQAVTLFTPPSTKPSMTAFSLVSKWIARDLSAQPNSGDAIYNINLLIFTDVANLLPNTRQFQGYTIEAESSPFHWEQLCEIDLHQGELYSSSEKSDFFSPVHVQQLSDVLRRGMPPNSSAAGWSAWQCWGTDCTRAPMRLRLVENSGRVSLISLPAKSALLPTQLEEPPAFAIDSPKQLTFKNGALLAGGFHCGGALAVR